MAAMRADDPEVGRARAASIIIPAHDEERTIGRLLDSLLETSQAATFEIIVVCNGCTDGTAEVARSRGVDVVELASPSKRDAMRHGDDIASHYPRVHLDADVEISAADVHALVAAVGPGGYLASAPRRRLPRDGVHVPVRWYYDVWEALPQVRSGMFGRGVIALSREGSDRARALPPSMSDDLVVAEAFAPYERVIVEEAVVVVHPARTLRDLLRRRVRVNTGNAQADLGALRAEGSRTSLRTLLDIRHDNPLLLLKAPVFLAVTLATKVLARRAIRRGDFTTWHRDESSRR